MSDDDDVDPLLETYAEHLDGGGTTPPEEFAAARGKTDAATLRALRHLRDAAGAFGAAAAAGPAAPRTLGPYRISGVLGRGGAGVVYRAERDDRPGEAFALKTLSFAASASARAALRFRREAAALARVDHPGVVRVRDAGEAPEGAYLAMDLIEGAGLETARDLGVRRAVEIVRALADAVAAIHAAGVVHRDLKPANVVLRADGAPVILDFGLAAAEGAPSVTGAGDVLGTPRYMAPEQARGEEAGPEADVYALGAILLELAGGAAPHAEVAATRLMETLRTRPAARVRALIPGFPAELARVVDRALEFDARDRYRGAAALRDDLDRFLVRSPVRAGAPGVVARLRRFGRIRRRALAVVGGALIAAAFGAAAFRASVEDPADRARGAALLASASAARLDGEDARSRADAAVAARLLPEDELPRYLAAEAASDAAWAAPWLRALAAAERRIAAGDAAGAFPFAERAATLAPDSSLAAHRLGLAAAATDRPDLAFRSFDRAARLLPGSRRAAVDFGRASEARKEHAEAARAYAETLKEKPDDGDLWYRLARAQAFSGQYDAAFASASNALSRLGEKGLKVYVLYGAMLDANGRRAEARAAYDEVLRRKPRNVSALFNKAVSFDSEHRPAEAAALYREVRAADPRYLRATVALAHLHAGASEDVCEGCREAYARHPECKDAAAATALLLDLVERAGPRDGPVFDFVATTAPKVGAVDAVLARVEVARVAAQDETLRAALDDLADDLRRPATRPAAGP